ncbi:MAG: 4'-phosphopantetheinyl transferase superfamily protein [Clostridia bacterium]|nr:4'-phosphopantetheinyl transferase superfamily protein [Clostridia bacterium]
MIIIRIDFTNENMTHEEEHNYAIAMRDSLLDKYAFFDVPPMFDSRERGKPYISNSDVSYSVSHTKGCIACAVSVPDIPSELNLCRTVSESGEYMLDAVFPCEIGIDFEYIDRARSRDRVDAIAGRYFSEGERARLDCAEDKVSDFYRIWTSKESFVKCTGEGMREISRADTADCDGFVIYEFEVTKKDADYAASVCIKLSE